MPVVYSAGATHAAGATDRRHTALQATLTQLALRATMPSRARAYLAGMIGIAVLIMCGAAGASSALPPHTRTPGALSALATDSPSPQSSSSSALRQLQQADGDYNISKPLIVCTASIQDFGARCNGAPDPSLEDDVKPVGPVPPQGWCPLGDDFCGYSVKVFECVIFAPCVSPQPPVVVVYLCPLLARC